MKQFYKSILDEEDKRNVAILAATSSIAVGTSKNVEMKEEKEEGIIRRAEKINKDAGYQKVQVNDNGELVDDRQLLNAGLNVVKKKTIITPKRSEVATQKDNKNYSSGNRKDRRRETEMIEQQLIAQEKLKRKAEEEVKARILTQTKSSKTESAISSARERYLARKRETENKS